MTSTVEQEPVEPVAGPRRSGPWDRLVNALPALAFLATFGWFFKNRSARTVFGSGRGVLTVTVIIGGYVLTGFVLRRLVRRQWVAPVVLAVVVLGLAAWIVRPYYVDETANRSLIEDPVVDASDLTSSTIAAPSTDPATTEASAPKLRHRRPERRHRPVRHRDRCG
ncbi:MAG: hypothetical protein WKF43_17760 [Acidimicrobiales bacterium]